MQTVQHATPDGSNAEGLHAMWLAPHITGISEEAACNWTRVTTSTTQLATH